MEITVEGLVAVMLGYSIGVFIFIGIMEAMKRWNQ